MSKTIFMKKIKVTLNSNLSLSDTLERIKDLFNYESIKFFADSNSIKSSYIPIPIISMDWRLYTKKNWVGINPFILISSIEITLTVLSTNQVRVDMSINQFRGAIIYFGILFFTGLVAANLPVLWGGILLFITIAVFARLIIFNLCIRKLIKYEILHEVS